MRDRRKDFMESQVIWFENVYQQFLKDNEGYSNVLSYIEGKYKGKKSLYCKVARKAGYKAYYRTDKATKVRYYFFEA